MALNGPPSGLVDTSRIDVFEVLSAHTPSEALACPAFAAVLLALFSLSPLSIPASALPVSSTLAYDDRAHPAVKSSVLSREVVGIHVAFRQKWWRPESLSE